jgi:tRNA (adenine37-N6)-methyltransferase
MTTSGAGPTIGTVDKPVINRGGDAMKLAIMLMGLAVAAAGCRIVDHPAVAGRPEAAASSDVPGRLSMTPIGKVELQKDGSSILRISPPFVPGLRGLDGFSHVQVLYWFDRNDTPEKRAILQVHPRNNPDNPLTGVFACRAPVRPNLIGLSVCRIVSVTGDAVRVEGLDAFDQTPLVDLKPFIPPDEPTRDIRLPAWTRSPGRPPAAPR